MSKQGKILVSTFLVLVLVSALAVAAFAETGGYPSTNEANKEAGLPHVNFVAGGPGWVELQFVVPTKFQAEFEVRIDNAPPGDKEHEGAKHYDFIPEDTYYEPHIVIEAGNEPRERTLRFNAKGLVQVRHAAGAESDWYFDWVSFEVEPPPQKPQSGVIFAKHMYSKLFYEILEKLGDYWKAVEEWLRQQ